MSLNIRGVQPGRNKVLPHKSFRGSKIISHTCLGCARGEETSLRRPFTFVEVPAETGWVSLAPSTSSVKSLTPRPHLLAKYLTKLAQVSLNQRQVDSIRARHVTRAARLKTKGATTVEELDGAWVQHIRRTQRHSNA